MICGHNLPKKKKICGQNDSGEAPLLLNIMKRSSPASFEKKNNGEAHHLNLS